MANTGQLFVVALLAVLGFGALGGSVFVNTYISDQLDEGIKDTLTIKPKSEDQEKYNDWTTNVGDEQALYKRYYFWNLTNPSDFQAGKAPVMEEIGPYVYRQFDTKFNVSFNSDNTEVSFMKYTYYVFDKALSKKDSGKDLSPDDKIINVNPQYMGVVGKAGGEMNLRVSFTAQTVATVVSGLQGDFTSSVLAQGPGTALDSIMGGLTTSFVSSVLAQGSGSALDTIIGGLTTSFPIAVTSTALATMIEGYTDSFLPQVQAGAVPKVLEEIQAGATENLYFSINATTAANVLNGSVGGIADVSNNQTAWNGFFNDTSFSSNFPPTPVKGVAEYLGFATDISTNAAEKLLYNGSALGIPGWFTDLATGTGILGFLQTFEKAVVNSTLMSLLTGSYEANSTQLGWVATYLTNYLILDNYLDVAFKAANFNLPPSVAAEFKFYEQWANASVLPTGFDINGDEQTPDGLEAGIDLLKGGIVNATDLNSTVVQKMFNDSYLYALTNDTGIMMWYAAAMGDPNNITALVTAYGSNLNSTRLTMVLQWLGNFKDLVVPGALVVKYSPLGVTEFDDLAYLQWGNSNITFPVALYDIDNSTSSNYTEFWAWSNRIDNSLFMFNASFTKTLLNGSHGLFNATELGTFLVLFNGGVSPDLVTINALWGLNATEAGALAGYIGYVISELIIKPVSILGVTSQADLGYLQWTSSALTGGNSTFDLDPKSAPNYPEFWAWAEHIANGKDLGVTFTVANATNLFTGATSLANKTNAAGFLAKLADGNFTEIEGIWGLNATEAGALGGYMSYLMAEFVTPEVLGLFGLFGVSTLTDLGYLQWSSSIVTEGKSTFELDPTSAPNYPEFWAWAAKVNSTASLGMSFSVAEAKVLLNGTYAMTNGTNTMNFLALIKGGTADNFTAIQTMWGINATKAGALAAYLSYMIEDFVKPTLLLNYNALGYSGPGDIGYLQYASPLLTGASLKELNPPMAGYPEPWAYYNRTLGLSYSLNVTNAKALLSGTYNFSDAVSIGTFLALIPVANSSDALTSATGVGSVNALFGTKLSKTDILMIGGWLSHIMTAFVDGFILQPLFDAGGGLVTTRTVDQWLWNGTDPLLSFLKAAGQTDSAVSNLFSNHTSMADAETKEVGKLDTIKTGKGNIDTVAEYVKYEEKTSYVGIWEKEEVIRGTDATQFHPGVESTETLEAWVADLLRVIKIAYEKDVEIEGIAMLRFLLHDDVLKVDPNYHQTIKGLANMTAAKGIPLFLSKPHFLDGDSSKLPGTANGMKPDAAKHQTYIDVEPISGTVMSARKRLQISLGVSTGTWYTKDVKDIILPLVWIEEGATILKETADKFIKAVYGAQNLQETISIGGPTAGILLLASAGFIAIRMRKSSP